MVRFMCRICAYTLRGHESVQHWWWLPRACWWQGPCPLQSNWMSVAQVVFRHSPDGQTQASKIDIENVAVAELDRRIPKVSINSCISSFCFSFLDGYSNTIAYTQGTQGLVLFPWSVDIVSDVQRTAGHVFKDFPDMVDTTTDGYSEPCQCDSPRWCSFSDGCVVKLSATVWNLECRSVSSGVDHLNSNNASEVWNLLCKLQCASKH